MHSTKILVVGDVHWSTYSSIVRSRGQKYSVRLEHLIKSLNWAEETAQWYGCDRVVYLGDFCDRPDLNCEEITALQEVKWSNCPHTFLVGNHESNMLSLEFSSTKFFEAINAEVVDKPISKEYDNFTLSFIPYITTNSVLELKDYVPNTDKKKIVFAHQDIAGLKYGAFESQSGFKLDDIKESCNLFINGHLHNEASYDNVILAGNLCGQTFNEDAELYSHSVHLLTIGDNIIVDSYENPYALNFYKKTISDDCNVDELIKSLKNNAVVSFSCSSKKRPEVIEAINYTYKIVEYRTVLTNNEHTTSDNDYNFIVTDHIEQFIKLAQQKFGSSPELDDELTRLGA